MEQSFTFSFGDFDLEEITGYNFQWLVYLLTLAYILLTAVIMVNLLIAMMGECRLVPRLVFSLSVVSLSWEKVGCI